MNEEEFYQAKQEHDLTPSFDSLTKKENTIPAVQDYLNFIIDSVGSGLTSSIEAYATVQTLEKMFKATKQAIDLTAQEDADRYTEKTFEKYGYRVTKKDGSKNWDFKECKEWIKAKEHLKQVEEDLKEAYRMKDKGFVSVSTETGEVKEYENLPTLEYNKPSLSVKKL
jgi:hypothetical protein